MRENGYYNNIILMRVVTRPAYSAGAASGRGSERRRSRSIRR